MADYALHPLCTLFARMQGAEFDALCADILANGLQQPIVLHEDMVLDGGNRYRACRAVGVEPRFAAFAGDDAAAFVLSANLHRRHMEAGQRAAIVALAQDWQQAHGHGGERKSAQEATLPLEKRKSTIAARAARSEASERTQKVADKLARQNPDLCRQVALGEISLPKAAAQLEPPKRKALPRAATPPAPQTTPAGEDVTGIGRANAVGDAEQLLADLQREIKELQAQLAALLADDGKAEVHRATLALQQAERTRDDAMDSAARHQGRAQWLEKELRRIARAVGAMGPLREVAAAVEALVRRAGAANVALAGQDAREAA